MLNRLFYRKGDLDVLSLCWRNFEIKKVMGVQDGSLIWIKSMMIMKKKVVEYMICLSNLLQIWEISSLFVSGYVEIAGQTFLFSWE